MKRLFVLILTTISLSTFAQDIPLWVVASAGANSTSSSISVDWTLGETAVTLLESDGYLLTQGFHQADLFLTSIDDNINISSLDVTIFPNPVRGTFNLVINSDIDNQTETTIEVVDITGRLTMTKKVNIHPNQPCSVDVQSLNAGVYLVRVINSSRVKLIKLIKE